MADPITLTKDQSVKFKIKVGGVEKEVSLTEDKLVEAIQKSEDYTVKTQELAEKEKTLKASEEQVKGLKSIIDEMETEPKLKEALNKVYSDFKSGKLSKSDKEKTDTLKKIDKWIEEASDPDKREQLRDIREAIKEESGVEKISLLENEIKTLKDEISTIKSTATLGIADKIEREISALEERFGKDLVVKHSDEIRKMAIKYPQNPIPKIFKYICPDEEYDRAVLDSAKRKEQEELERKKKGALPNETAFTPKTEIKKDRFGRVDIGSIAQRVREKLGKV